MNQVRPPASELALAATPNAVAWARRHTVDILQRWRFPAEGIDVARLLVAELATNAIQPARPPGGDILLVVENSATWWSLVRSLPDNHRLGYVARGFGGTFRASVNTLADGHGIAEIRYFGDLDLSGIRIPYAASKTASERGLPTIQPLSDFTARYWNLDAHEVRRREPSMRGRLMLWSSGCLRRT